MLAFSGSCLLILLTGVLLELFLLNDLACKQLDMMEVGSDLACGRSFVK